MSVIKGSDHGLRYRKMVPHMRNSSSDDEVVLLKSVRTAHGHHHLVPEECPLKSLQNGMVSSLGLDSDSDVDSQTDLHTPLVQPESGPVASEPTGKKEKPPELKAAENGESSLSITLQVFIPYIIAGLGTVGAGMVLDIVQHWEVFQEISEVFILVPALLGLKGNLEMTLAARLSTQAQAIVVGFLASVAAMVMGWIPEGKFNLSHGLLLCASSILTASVASLLLGSVMVAVIFASRKCNINPDNVATPIAASLGDLVTLSLLAAISSFLYEAIRTQVWLAPTLILVFVLLIPLWVWVSLRNKYTKEVIYSGWTPVISAMVISSVGGLILDFTVANYHGVAVFQPVINGVGGNLVAIQASRLSTSLHQISTPGQLTMDIVHGCPNPCNTFCGKNTNSKAARVLMALVIPGHLIFMYTISFMKAGHTTITPVFVAVYLSAAVLQVALLLHFANWMVHYMWRHGDDPDNFVIPYLTAFGDLLGTGFLAVAFHLLYIIGDKDADVGD